MANIVAPRGYEKVVAQGTISYGLTATKLTSIPVACDLIVVIPAVGNTGATFWGGSGVTTSNGIPVLAYPEGDVIPLRSTGLVYLISDTAAQSARYVALKA